jgi:ribosomal protein S18 acetylase RimI-like enzyme
MFMIINSPVNIRRAEHADIPRLTALLEILFSIEEDFDFNESLQRRGLKILLEYESACVLVAEVEGKIIGMCTGQLIVSTAEGGPALLVEDLIVDRHYRCRGAGRKLIMEIIEWGRKKGACRVQLMADRNNAPALDFYRCLGWQTTNLICLRKK